MMLLSCLINSMAIATMSNQLSSDCSRRGRKAMPGNGKKKEVAKELKEKKSAPCLETKADDKVPASRA